MRLPDTGKNDSEPVADEQGVLTIEKRLKEYLERNKKLREINEEHIVPEKSLSEIMAGKYRIKLDAQMREDYRERELRSGHGFEGHNLFASYRFDGDPIPEVPLVEHSPGNNFEGDRLREAPLGESGLWTEHGFEWHQLQGAPLGGPGLWTGHYFEEDPLPETPLEESGLWAGPALLMDVPGHANITENEEYEINLTYLYQVKLKQGLKLAMSISGEGNAYLQESRFWKLYKEDKASCSIVLRTAAGLVYLLACLLEPFMPSFSVEVLKQLNMPPETQVSLTDEKGDIDGSKRPWEFLLADHKIGTPAPLFKKLSDKDVEFFRQKFARRQGCGARLEES